MTASKAELTQALSDAISGGRLSGTDLPIRPEAADIQDFLRIIANRQPGVTRAPFYRWRVYTGHPDGMIEALRFIFGVLDGSRLPMAYEADLREEARRIGEEVKRRYPLDYGRSVLPEKTGDRLDIGPDAEMQAVTVKPAGS